LYGKIGRLEKNFSQGRPPAFLFFANRLVCK
jgi:hypothetical protein